MFNKNYKKKKKFWNFDKNEKKTCQKSTIFSSYPEKKFLDKSSDLEDLLYEFHAKTRLTVHCRLDILNHGEMAWPCCSLKMMKNDEILDFKWKMNQISLEADNFHLRTSRRRKFDRICLLMNIINKIFVNNEYLFFYRTMRIWNFRILLKININVRFSKRHSIISRRKNSLEILSGWEDLLYEFPAETRLTVHRRLDIRKQYRIGPEWKRARRCAGPWNIDFRLN